VQKKYKFYKHLGVFVNSYGKEVPMFNDFTNFAPSNYEKG